MKATTPKPRKRSTATAKKAAKTDGSGSATIADAKAARRSRKLGAAIEGDKMKVAHTGRITLRANTTIDQTAHAGHTLGAVVIVERTARRSRKPGSSVAGKEMAHIGRVSGSAFTARKSEMTGQFVSIRAEKIPVKRKEPAWVRQEVKGLMEALSGR